MKISSHVNFIQPQSNFDSANPLQAQRLSSVVKSDTGAAEKPLESGPAQHHKLLSANGTSAADKSSQSNPKEGRPTSIEGKNIILILDDSLKSERMLNVYNRLSSVDQENIIDTNLINDEDFLNLAEQLSDDELADFMSVAKALQKAPALDAINRTFISSQTLNTFTQNLLELNSADREEVLQQGKIHAAKVPSTESGETYNRQALQSSNSFSAANDIRNFVLAVNSSENVPDMLDNLQKYSADQQSDLLAILPNEIFADRVIERLDDIPEDLVGSALSFFADTLQKVDSFSPMMAEDLEGTKGVSAGLGFDNNSQQTRFDMLDKTLSLIENYDFDEQQLNDMFSSLGSLDVTNQRAYIEITDSGLDLLTGGNQSSEKIDLRDEALLIKAIDEVRDSYSARDLVAKARMGGLDTSDTGSKFYEIKAKFTATQDQSSSIDLLVGNAFSQLESASTNDSEYKSSTENLAQNLLQLDADERDQLSGQVSAELNGQGPLDQIEKEQLSEQLGAFSERANTLASTKDIDSLLLAQQKVEQQVENQNSDDFWRAADAAAENVDQFAELLLESEPKVQRQIISFLADNHPTQTSNDQAKAAQNIDSLFSAFESGEDERQIANFFAREGY
ncbi:MAG: hypothetical protein V7784_05215 [Oceanospirillaceae bacterium]